MKAGCLTVLLLTGLAAIAGPMPTNGLLAHFNFKGDGTDATGVNPAFDFTNVTLNASSIYLNGIYEYAAAGGGYRATVAVPRMNYETFTVAVRFELAPPRAGASQPNLITGGTGYRWFGVRFADTQGGKLIVYLDNGDYAQRIEGTAIQVNTWTTVVCTVNLPARRVLVYQDGKLAGTMQLPKDFALDVLQSADRESDKNWSFTNYSGGDTFHGWVDDLAIYDRVLTADEIAGLL